MIEFGPAGFETLKTEVRVLAELVALIGSHLTPEQKAAVIEAQKTKIMPQEDFKKLTDNVSQKLGVERGIRIKRLLVP
jgi:hypothetical protein